MHRKNNFDFLRLLFASAVIITHSYPLSGIPEHDWLYQLTNGQLLLSHTGVKGFFILSGYLIYQSVERSDTVIDFFWKRSLRLFPALIVVLVLTLLLVPFVYENKVPVLQNRSWWTYLPNNLVLYKTQYVVKGVFESNPYKGAINGSLWTIPYEFTMYVLLAFLLPIKKNENIVTFILFSIFSVLLIGNLCYFKKAGEYNYILRAQNMINLGAFFIAGAILAKIKAVRINHKNIVIVSLFILLVLSVWLHVYSYVIYIVLPPAVILFGQSSTPIINGIGKRLGDLSYGIYIYRFPVQQALVYYFKLNYLELMAWGLLITYGLAYLSWHLVEKRVLKFKKLSLLPTRAPLTVAEATYLREQSAGVLA